MKNEIHASHDRVRLDRRSRVSALAFAFGLGLAATGPAAAQDTWRLSSMMTPDSFEGMAYTRFAELASEYTDGAVSVQVYPSEQLGDMDSVIEQLSQGVIHLAPSGSSFMSRWVDGIQYAASPFLFDDYDHWARFIRSDLFQGWLDEVEERANIKILGDIPAFPRGSFRVLMASQPIEGLEDIDGLRVRQYQDDLVISAWEHLGAEVRVLPWGEVYDGINRGIVDAVTSPAEQIESMRFYEVAPHIVRTDEYPQAVAFMMNARAFDALTAEQQEGLLRAHEEASAYARSLIEEQADTLVQRLTEEYDIEFDVDFDTSAFVERMQGFYQGLADEGELPEGLMETVEATRDGG